MLQPDQWKQLQGMEKHMEREITKMIRVYGIVQGVGFRPTVSRHAMARGIRGSVSNKGPYVEIYAQGTKEQIEGFLNSLKEHPPKRAAVLKINTEDITADTTDSLNILTLSKVKKQKGKSLFPRILQSAMSARKKCLTRKTDGICIRLSTAPAVDQGLRFWMLCRMTGNAQV